MDDSSRNQSDGQTPRTNVEAAGLMDWARVPRRRRFEPLVIDAENELRILEGLRANLTVHHETLEDPDLMLVLADSQTTLLDAIDRILEADLCDEALISGLKLYKDTMAARLHRLEERRQSRRSVLEQVLFLLERKSLQRPTATVTLSERPPVLVVEEEAQIPARFFDLRPTLNRRLTKEALEAGDTIPGARLSNGTITLSVHRR